MTETEGTILVTGFGPFGPIKENPSAAVARGVAAGLGKSLLALEESISVSNAGLADFYTNHSADFDRAATIIHIGVAAGATKVRFEVAAANVRAHVPKTERDTWFTADHPDTGALLPIDASPAALDLLPTSFPVHSHHVHAWLTVNSPRVCWSRDAGTFFCNEIYYRSLARSLSSGSPQQVLFVHVPSADCISVDECVDLVLAFLDAAAINVKHVEGMMDFNAANVGSPSVSNPGGVARTRSFKAKKELGLIVTGKAQLDHLAVARVRSLSEGGNRLASPHSLVRSRTIRLLSEPRDQANQRAPSPAPIYNNNYNQTTVASPSSAEYPPSVYSPPVRRLPPTPRVSPPTLPPQVSLMTNANTHTQTMHHHHLPINTSINYTSSTMATQPYSLDNMHQQPLSPIKKSHFTPLAHAPPSSPPPHLTTRPLSPFQTAQLVATRPPRSSSRNNNATYYNVIVAGESAETSEKQSDHRVMETVHQINRPFQQQQQSFHQIATATTNNARSPSRGRRNNDGGIRMDRGHPGSSSSSSNNVKSPPITNTVTVTAAFDEIVTQQPLPSFVASGNARKNSAAGVNGTAAAEFFPNRSPSRGRRGGSNHDDGGPIDAFPNRSPSRGRRGGGAGGIAMDRGISSQKNNATTNTTTGGKDDQLPVIRTPRSLSRGPRSSRSRERQVVLEYSDDMMFKEPVVVGVVDDSF
ncbi:hypothetical protein HK100_008928 [Physocladia obscura]|uniref:Pyroglutamyl-peptidase I n=1 Tax=Physocladia obscura TaxID=109957 RepID=A0AAD5T3M4_9FUNG|nr:hypothetical protein HK100_008928 [Physocladia obscura]